MVRSPKEAAESAVAAHGSSCPSRHLTAGVNLLQEKWVLLIVRVLLSGPQGFNDMARNAGDVNSTTLAQRLARLEKAGLVKKTVQSVMPPKTSYELTQAGRDLKPVIEAIESWSEKYGLACEEAKGEAA
ncbi:MAG TPA: helix-turn-helix domain-containing protein [Oscillatoriaceae cyanobacterium]|nr:helix-turn-helix domain-containing protein [Pirellulales bacterium]